jgi:hypothetical protein
MAFEMTTGSRAQVWHGTAKKTSGGLTKKDLKKTKDGRIVSRKLSEKMKKEGLKRLTDAGYTYQKGKFGPVKIKDGKKKSKK